MEGEALRAPKARRVHILPVGSSPSEDRRRLELLTPSLKALRANKVPMKSGLFLKASSGEEFIVVKSEPAEALLAGTTDIFVEGTAVQRLDKVQFICLWDFENVRASQDSSALFANYISPYFRGKASDEAVNLVIVGESFRISGLDFQASAIEPTSTNVGIVDTNTMVFVDWDMTPELERIHIVPFQDTLPAAYEFDIYTDYLKPFLKRHKHLRLKVNDHFTFQGVQFKVVCCEPDSGRIGRNTTIYCEGVLHPSLRNLLPPELLEQLSGLPPGLQMLLLNTEALAGGYEERLMEVLSRRQGLTGDVIDRIELRSWEDSGPDGQRQCMVCLCNFEKDEEVRRLPCSGSHVFHASCIDEWLRRCTDCPICKTNVEAGVEWQAMMQERGSMMQERESR
eukprot:TRINITY_DN41917_c0_g1_i1.p1 TRINITY_DN41917_c0_g1~~TRINITY_DN41917_c0_g1_i1.p1  ORF type:complete len:396 (-),score=78.03 TRINITY_DN41917_c0_g1_i1:82-1269(-)